MYSGSNETKLNCDREGTHKHYNNLQTYKIVAEGWYRFMEPAGTRLPLVPPPSHGWYLETCGTAASAWVQNGSYPLI